MSSIANFPITIQTSSHSVPSTPSWFGEVTVIAHFLQRQSVLTALEEQVRFARRRFGHYDLIDFVVVLLGYAISGEATLETFYERVQPFATAFMALFGRERLPHRSTLSRFLATLDQATVEALHTVDCERSVRPAIPGAHEERSCEPGRRSCKHIPISGWGRFLGQATGTIVENFCRQSRWRVASAQTQSMPLRQVVVRLDGHYGNGAIVADLAGLSYVMRGKDYHLLALPQVQARLKESPDARTTHPETGTQRALFDVPDLVVTATGERSRVIVATHPVSSTAAPVGVTREEVVYELFFTALPPVAFTSADVVDLYLGRGAFETVLSDEDQEQDPDRWCSHSACGQEVWQILSQWVWNEAP